MEILQFENSIGLTYVFFYRTEAKDLMKQWLEEGEKDEEELEDEQNEASNVEE